MTAGDQTLVREVKAGSSYLGQNDLRVHFGLAGHPAADRLEIAWPGGRVDVLSDIGANQIVSVREGGEILSTTPLDSPPAPNAE